MTLILKTRSHPRILFFIKLSLSDVKNVLFQSQENFFRTWRNVLYFLKKNSPRVIFFADRISFLSLHCRCFENQINLNVSFWKQYSKQTNKQINSWHLDMKRQYFLYFIITKNTFIYILKFFYWNTWNLPYGLKSK